MEPSREDALKKLKELNVILEFENIKAFHGRATRKNENFVVRDNFNNRSSFTKQYSKGGFSGLYATDFSHAKQYADFRVEETYKKSKTILEPKVFEIVPKQSGLLIFDLTKLENTSDLKYYLNDVLNFNQEELKEIEKNCLTGQEQKEFQTEFLNLVSCHNVASLMPELFGTKQDLNNLKHLNKILSGKQNNQQPKLITDQELEDFIKRTKQDENGERICEICGAINSYQILKSGDLKMAISKLQSGLDFFEDSTLNLELFQNFLEAENIVGVKQRLWTSEYINKQNFDTFFCVLWLILT